MAKQWQIVLVLVIWQIACCLANNNAKQTQSSSSSQRQAGVGGMAGGAGLLSTLGSMVPGVVSNMLPLVLLFGLGALMVPALGLGLLLREGRRSDQYYYRSFPSFNINTSAIMDGLGDVFERVMKAIDNVDKKYN